MIPFFKSASNFQPRRPALARMFIGVANSVPVNEFDSYLLLFVKVKD